MKDSSRLVAVLLAAVVILLAANLIVMTGRSFSVATPAMADIVTGKNNFTTHSPDGRTVYMWYYDQGTPMDKTAAVFYLGQIQVGGKFEKP